MTIPADADPGALQQQLQVLEHEERLIKMRLRNNHASQTALTLEQSELKADEGKMQCDLQRIENDKAKLAQSHRI